MYHPTYPPAPPLRCTCGKLALTYDETRGYCGPCYLKLIAPDNRDKRVSR